MSQLAPTIYTNNQHSHILFIYDALHAIFSPSPRLPSDLFPVGVPNKTACVFLSLIHTFYMSYRPHTDLFNRLVTIWCTARCTNLVFPYFMIPQYAMDWATGLILPYKFFFSPSRSDWIWGQQFSYAINTGEFSPEGKAGSAWNWPPTSIL